MTTAFRLLSVFSFAAIALSSCSPVVCTFYCEDRTVSILVDDVVLGNEFAKYSAPRGTEYVNVKLVSNGLEIYSKDYYVKDYHKNNLIEIQVPQNYKKSEVKKFHD